MSTARACAPAPPHNHVTQTKTKPIKKPERKRTMAAAAPPNPPPPPPPNEEEDLRHLAAPMSELAAVQMEVAAAEGKCRRCVVIVGVKLSHKSDAAARRADTHANTRPPKTKTQTQTKQAAVAAARGRARDGQAAGDDRRRAREREQQR
jgi:hypothetical protein